MPWSINRRNSLPFIVRISQTKGMQSKGWLSDGFYLYKNIGIMLNVTFFTSEKSHSVT